MAKARSLVGLDVHAAKIVAAVLDADTGELQFFEMNGESVGAAAFCAGLPRPVRVAYEAGPTGYALARDLSKRKIECVVAAPSKIPRASGDRVKNDRRDAEHLVRLLSAGKLHPVRVPGLEEEALRDLVRARETLRLDLMRARHRLSKMLMRHGIVFDQLEPDPAIAALARGEVDLAITHAYSNVPPLPTQGLLATALVTEDVLLAATTTTAPPTTRSGTARLADLATSDWIIPHADLTCAEMVKRACGAAGFQPNIVAEATDYSVQLQLVAAEIGVALIPRLAAQALPDGLRLLPLHRPVERHHFALTRLSARSDPSMNRILELLEDNATRLLAQQSTAKALEALAS
jgi:LysR substrate binding domain/Transposase